MSNSDPLNEATRLLRRAVDDPGDVDEMPVGRDAAVERIADALRARARTNRRRRAIRMPLVAAAVLVVVGGGAFAVHRAQRGSANGTVATSNTGAGRDLGRLVDPNGAVTALRDGRSESVNGNDRLAEGTELRTSAAEASLDFDSGTHVTLGGSSRVRLVEQSARKRFALEAGSFSARVSKLGAGERFVVATPDAEVEVRGTAFRVTLVTPDPSCEGGTPTRLEVSEGVVVVTHGGAELRVAAGEHWPSCAAALGASAATAVVASPATASSEVRVAKTAATPPSSIGTVVAAPRPEASSRLAEQNDLFDEAVRLERSGNAMAAITKLDRLLADYPSGPLAESAEAKRMRLLAASDPVRARSAAREYLQRHPRGFARAEAEALVAGSP